MTDFIGTFRRYAPTTIPHGYPANAMFAKRADGYDWYATIARLPVMAGHKYFMACGGRIVSVSDDPGLFGVLPEFSVYRTADFEPTVGHYWDGAVMRAPDRVVEVTALQLRKALRAADLLGAFDIALSRLSDDARDEWAYGLAFRKDTPVIAAVWGAMGMDAAALDALFAAAADY